PVFFLGFFGAAILLPIAAWRVPSTWMTAAAVVYWVGVMGVTFFGNIPLNNMLAALDLSTADAEQMKACRAAFGSRWVSLNNIRTLSAIGAMVLLSLAVVKPAND
ncbi:MAG TPA: anthrone oxygenase family protein, partial [Flavobacteriales bacterium]|nr:anthrone oxygenase family protein [Flavobacteriales bacterium]